DDLLYERAHRPFRIRNTSLRHHLPVSEASEARGNTGGPLRPVAEGDDAAADLQRSLCGRAAPAFGQRDRLSEGASPDPGARRFHGRYPRVDGVVRGGITGPWI